MTNQEQYEKMIIPNDLYTIDHDKMLLDAAKMIKEYCLSHNCDKCPFQKLDTWEECAISSRDYLDTTYPQTWEV